MVVKRADVKNWLKEHPTLADVCWVIPFFLLFGTISILHFFTKTEPPSDEPSIYPWVATVIVCFQWLPLVWRRERTAVVGLVVAAANFADIALSMPLVPTNLSAIIMVYSMAVYCNKRFSRIALFLGLLGAIWSSITRHGQHMIENEPRIYYESVVFFIVLQCTIMLLAWVSGNLIKERLRVVKELTEKAERLQFEQDQERKLAAADERARIAREMHDVIAHSLSVMIAQADGARYIASQDPQAAEKTLSVISDTGRNSLHEMRKLIGILRSDEKAETSPAPSLKDVPELVETTQLSGLVISFHETGVPQGEISSGAELTAYRVFQEAFTNILKHAGLDAKAKAFLVWKQDGVWMRIVDDGAAGDSPLDKSHGSQQGLIGMRERVQLYDGWVKAGPRKAGGYYVEAFIPYAKKG